MTIARRPTLLLTGPAGMLGSELLRRLCADPAAPRVVALCHTSTPSFPADIVRGDVCLPRLGLEPALHRRLQSDVQEIIHCAADTRFGLGLEASRAVNTAGTRHILEFARGCARLKKLAHLSTVYVAGDGTGVIPEEFLPPPCRFFNTYQQAKYEAEELVRQAMRDLPAMVIRLSSLAGDSATGRFSRFTYVHRLIRLLPRNLLPVAPGDPGAPVDLVPTDYAAEALLYLFRFRFIPGGVFQVCAGPAGSLCLKRMVRLVLDSLPADVDRKAIRLPKFVPLAEYERFARDEAARGSELARQVLRGLGYFLPHLALRQEFDTTNTRAALAGSRVLLPPIESYFPKVVAYCFAA